MKASVCICTFNGSARIEPVLLALARQTVSPGEWELLVIDNASTDGTGAVAERVIRERLGGRGRVVLELTAGLSHARARAAREAQGDIICFLDDDNVPEENFLESTVQAFAERPRAGVIGGKVIARWEVSPTPLAEAVAPFALAVCDLGEKQLLLDGRGGGIVGAGISVRRGLLQDIYSQSGLAAKVTGRKGGNFMSGEDLVISIVARKLGWEIWYVPTMKLAHCLPAGRMDKNYLLRLYEGIGRGQFAVRRIYDWKARTPLAWLIAAKDFARWLAGRRRLVATDLTRQYPAIAGDLHDLNQALTLGRARQAFSWPR